MIAGRLGDDASMLAHVAAFGVIWAPAPKPPKRRKSTAKWTERKWSTWQTGNPGHWTHDRKKKAAL